MNVDQNQLTAFIQQAGQRAARKPVNVTFRGRQGYSKDIGKYRKPDDGKLIARRFWLGHDQSRAVWLAGVYKDYHDHFVSTNGGLWTDEHLRLVNLIIEGEDQTTRQRALMARSALDALAEDAAKMLAARPPAPALPELPQVPAVRSAPIRADSPTTTANVPAEQATLYGAIKAYVAHLKGKRTSDKHKERAEQVVEVNLKRVRKDCPMSEVDYLWLDSLCDHYKSRPKNLRDGKRLTAGGVRNVLTYLRLFFTWCDDVGYGGWELPRKAAKCFKVRTHDLMTPAEIRAAGTIPQLDIATLKAIYAKANDHEQAIILTALFCGMTQQELAVLEKDEFDLDAAKLVHVRHKTKVTGDFWLPPELVALLRKEFKARRKDKLVFRTAEGNALVTFKDGRQTSDAVRQMWDDLRDKAEVPDALSFKFIRKLLADFVTRHGGEELGMVAMSHAPQSVLGRNYTTSRPFERFHELQRKLYDELKAADFFPREAEAKEHAKAA